MLKWYENKKKRDLRPKRVILWPMRKFLSLTRLSTARTCIWAKKGDVNKQVLKSKHARRLPSVDALKSKIEAVWYNVLSVDAVKMACKSFKDR